MEDKSLRILFEKALMVNEDAIRLNQNLINENGTLRKLCFGLGLVCLYLVNKSDKQNAQNKKGEK